MNKTFYFRLTFHRRFASFKLFHLRYNGDPVGNVDTLEIPQKSTGNFDSVIFQKKRKQKTKRTSSYTCRVRIFNFSWFHIQRQINGKLILVIWRVWNFRFLISYTTETQTKRSHDILESVWYFRWYFLKWRSSSHTVVKTGKHMWRNWCSIT